jgi:hypothetical protein
MQQPNLVFVNIFKIFNIFQTLHPQKQNVARDIPLKTAALILVLPTSTTKIII